jgi:predicted transcriptional regulator
MKVSEIIATLDGALLTGSSLLDVDIQSAFGADLMSDVMAFSKENVMLLTGLINPQSIRTADLMDIRVIVFVRGKNPSKEMVDEAERNGMAVITTRHSMFLSCGRLYEAGIREGGMR